MIWRIAFIQKNHSAIVLILRVLCIQPTVANMKTDAFGLITRQ